MWTHIKDVSPKEYSSKYNSSYQRNKRKEIKDKKKAAYERVKKHREMKKQKSCNISETPCLTPFKFSSRVQKMRALAKVNSALPRTPKKKVATLISLLEKKKSPTVTTLKKNENTCTRR